MSSTPSSIPVTRRWLRQALTWLVGVGLLAWLLSHVPLDTVWEALGTPSALVWAGTLMGLLLSYLMRAARLQVVMGLNDGLNDQAHGGAQPRKALGLRLDALRVILMHNAAVNLLPMRAGELSFPWLASTQLRMPLAQAVASLLWMRLQDLAVLLALGLLLWPGLPMVWRAAGLTLLVLGWFAGLKLLDLLQASSNASAPTSKQRQLLQRLHAALVDPHHHRPAAWGFTWANWAIKLTAGALLLSAITQTSLGAGWAGALGGELAAVVPIQGPAGFGTYEAGVWAGFALSTPASTLAQGHAVAAALALHLCFLLCAVAAGAIAWATPSWSSSRLPD
ncbi:lysylphosphatidylglycerol synthase domain-containing protein [Aquabacterium sp.]|jgi:hypothetical protein|uniref:lysylphosphatidylglycerol synthase domain-containing protein n=1 Tax=Aquabacterium sp. TaxID=1872578 RepID=UPI003BAEC7BC